MPPAWWPGSRWAGAAAQAGQQRSPWWQSPSPWRRTRRRRRWRSRWWGRWGCCSGRTGGRGRRSGGGREPGGWHHKPGNLQEGEKNSQLQQWVWAEVCTAQTQEGKRGWLRTRLLQLGSHFLQSGHLLVLWGVDDHHSAAHQAQQAAQLPQQVESFSKQIGGKNGTAWDRKTSAGALRSFREGTVALRKLGMLPCDTRTQFSVNELDSSGLIHNHMASITAEPAGVQVWPVHHSSCVSKVQKCWMF